METKTVVEANLDSYEFGYWDEATCDYTKIDSSNIKEYAEKFECSEELLETIRENFNMLKDCLLDDLKDIWKKLENS